jgi:hypothetical protein
VLDLLEASQSLFRFSGAVALSSSLSPGSIDLKRFPPTPADILTSFGVGEEEPVELARQGADGIGANAVAGAALTNSTKGSPPTPPGIYRSQLSAVSFLAGFLSPCWVSA